MMDVTMFKDLMDAQVYMLAIVLYIVGIGLKKTSLIKNKFIPIILGILGVVFIALYIFSTNALSSFQEICAAIFAAFTQGVLCAAAAVYANQIFKQLIKIEGIDEKDADLVKAMEATQPVSEEVLEKIKEEKEGKKEVEEKSDEVERPYDEDEN